MKSKLGAVVSPILTCQHRRNISESISAYPWLTLSNGDGRSNSVPLLRTLASLQLQGIGSLNLSYHSSSSDENDFSELGAPVKQGAGKLLRLMTQKPEPYMENSPCLKQEVLNRIRASQAVLKLKNHNGGSRHTVDTENTSYTTMSSSVTIEGVPSADDLPQLIEAISVFGVICRASMRTVPNGPGCCDVEFESIESSRKALSVGGITVRSFCLPIRPLHVLETVTIRIQNISDETSDAAIHSTCMSFGSLEGLSRTREDAINALYNVKDNLESQSILKRLNNTITGHCRWSAELLTRDSTPSVMANNEDAKRKLGLQISSRVAEMKRQAIMKKLDLEDLGYLHLSIMHLEEMPSIGDLSL